MIKTGLITDVLPPAITAERDATREYHRVANRFATCEFVGTFGSQEVCTNVKPIMETHDRLAIQQGAPLA